MKPIRILAIALLVSVSIAPALAAEPTLHEVYQAVEAGRLTQAETMMEQVLRDHPNSAKAHFIEAEIQAKEGNAARARSELATAERLAPGLPFAKPEAISGLQRLLERSPVPHTAAMPVQAWQTPAAGSFPWSLLLIGLALLAAIVYFVRTLSRPRLLPAGSGYGVNGPSFGSGQPVGAGGIGPMPGGGGIGSGILGGLATGAAVGAGMVAGEALMHRVFDGSSHRAVDTGSLDPLGDIGPAPDYDMGGTDFGVSDTGSWDDGGSSGDWN